ncbi:MAG: esterase-like activity of phytase family protein [Halothece sp.]
MVKLEGFSVLPADTFAEGPPAGENISANGFEGPFPGQPVQGLSGVQLLDQNSFFFLSDNGFGRKENSSDYLLRTYQLNPDFAGTENGDASVKVEDFIQFADPNNEIPFNIQQEGSNERLLTGSDFDTESFVIDDQQEFWVGEEFGPFVLNFNQDGTLQQSPIPTPNINNLDTLNGQDPLVIGHRGASGSRPEHTLESYKVAIKRGADFIEPDLVATKDGKLIARHENALAQVKLNDKGEIVRDENGDPIVTQATTNVAEMEKFSDRLTVKEVDGELIGGWFSEDFTLEEIKQLKARERIPETRPENTQFNDQFEIPTFGEIIDLVKQVEEETGKEIGIYPETKHPTYFNKEGTKLNGEPIDMTLGQKLIDTLVEKNFTDPSRIFIQSFEIANLVRLQEEIMPKAGVDLPLVQLTGDFNRQFINDDGGGFSVPYDVVYNSNPNNREANTNFYEDFPININANTDYGDLANPKVLNFISDDYAEGLGPWKNSFWLREKLDQPVDANGDGKAEITSQLTGEVRPLIENAHEAGLQVHPYTLRQEETFLTLEEDGTPLTLEEEVERLVGELGADGFFTDFPGVGDRVRDQLVADQVRSPQNPEVLNGAAVANLPRSGGFEGMAFNPARTTAYPMLEKSVTGDPDDARRIYQFDLNQGEYEGLAGFYRMEDPSHAIGEITPINENEFLVIERDSKQAENAEFKKIFKVDLSQVNRQGFVEKQELVDLLKIDDPQDLNNDGSQSFSFPFLTIESVVVKDKNSIVVANDNNFPFTKGRPPEIDNNEIIQLQLDKPLDLDPRLGVDGLDEPLQPEQKAGKLAQLNMFETGFEGGTAEGDPLEIPATDPAGIAYHDSSGHLFLADSEISELGIVPDKVSGNVFEVSRDGKKLIRSYDLTDEATGAVNDEPTGITFDPVSDRFYVSNDNSNQIYRYKLQSEGENASFAVEDTISLEQLQEQAPLNLADSLTGDFEGVAVNADSGRIYAVDGSGTSVVTLRYDQGFEFINSFQLNSGSQEIVSDPEGISVNPETGNLFIVSATDNVIAEYTPQGDFLREFSLDNLSPSQIAAQGLAFGAFSASTNNPIDSLYIADGGVDNNDDPDERDGRVYETKPIPGPSNANPGIPEEEIDLSIELGLGRRFDDSQEGNNPFTPNGEADLDLSQGPNLEEVGGLG